MIRRVSLAALFLLTITLMAAAYGTLPAVA